MNAKGNRKLVVILTALVLAFVLAMYGRLTGDYTTIAVAAVTAFAAANAYEHHTRGNP
jgi:hypothetical protein